MVLYLILQQMNLKAVGKAPIIFFFKLMCFQPVYLAQRSISTSALTERTATFN